MRYIVRAKREETNWAEADSEREKIGENECKERWDRMRGEASKGKSRLTAATTKWMLAEACICTQVAVHRCSVTITCTSASVKKMSECALRTLVMKVAQQFSAVSRMPRDLVSGRIALMISSLSSCRSHNHAGNKKIRGKRGSQKAGSGTNELHTNCCSRI